VLWVIFLEHAFVGFPSFVLTIMRHNKVVTFWRRNMVLKLIRLHSFSAWNLNQEVIIYLKICLTDFELLAWLLSCSCFGRVALCLALRLFSDSFLLFFWLLRPFFDSIDTLNSMVVHRSTFLKHETDHCSVTLRVKFVVVIGLNPCKGFGSRLKGVRIDILFQWVAVVCYESASVF